MKFWFPDDVPTHTSGGYRIEGAGDMVSFPVRPYVPQSPGVTVQAYRASKTVHIVVLDAHATPLKSNWLIVHEQALPDLILALQYLQANGPLFKEVVKLDMEKQ